MSETGKATYRSGIIILVISAVCWSLNSPLVKTLHMDALFLAGMRALIAGIVLLPFVRPSRIEWKNPCTWVVFIAFSVHCTLIVLALKMTSAPIAVAMQFTAPVWLFFWERKKGEHISLKKTWPLIIILIGMAVFMFSKGEGVTTAGNIVAAGTSLSFAVLSWFSKKASGRNPIGMTSLSCLMAAAILLIFLCPNSAEKIRSIPSDQWPVLLTLGAVQTGMGYALYYLGLQRVSAKTAAMVSPIEMILGPLWVALFLHIYTDAVGIVAFLFVTAGVIGQVFVGEA